MQLYHQTLLKPSAIYKSYPVHIFPIKLKEREQKPKQLLLLKTNIIQMYHYVSIKQGQVKYQFKLFNQEEFFANIIALQPIKHIDQQMQKDLILVTLNNGKYQLLQWLPKSFKFAVVDQNMLFSSHFEVQNRLVSPIFGHYIAVNNEANLIMIASANWQYKIYQKVIGQNGIKLKQLCYLKNQPSSPSICMQLTSGMNNCCFYSLRLQMDEEGHKRTRVYTLQSENKVQFYEKSIDIKDNQLHMLIVRSGHNNILIFSKRYLYNCTKKQIKVIQLPQDKQICQNHYIRRLNKDKQQQFFIINQQNQVYFIQVDQHYKCYVNFVETIMPINHVSILERNLIFVISRQQDNYLISFSNKFKIQDKLDKSKMGLKIKEDKDSQLLAKNRSFEEIQILLSLPSAKVIRDMKAGNFQNATNKQIIITGSKNGGQKGFFSVIKYGLKVKQYLSINFTNPTGIWCLKKNIIHKNHSFIVLTFSRKTAIYYYQNKKLTQTNELKLQQNQQSIHINKLHDNSNVQVTPSKIRHIRQGNIKQIFIKGRIMKALAVNEGRQLFILLIGGYMEYYELTDKGQLKFIKEFTLDSEVHFIDYAIPQIIEGKPYSKLFVIGKNNYQISILTYQNKGLQLSISKNIKSQIYSLILTPKDDHYTIYIGTNFGKIIKLSLSKEGQIGQDVEQTIVGQKNVKLSKTSILNKYSIIRLSPQPMLSYWWQQQQQECTLPFSSIDFFLDISLQGMQSSHIFLTYYDNYIRFIQVCGFNNLLQQEDRDLGMPGKKILQINDYIGILGQFKMQNQVGLWRTEFNIINPKKQYAISKHIYIKNPGQKCLSLAYVSRAQNKGYLCFGCVLGYQSYPKTNFHHPTIKVYSFQVINDFIIADELYSYSIDDIPSAMEVYSDKLLIGIGRSINLYDIYNSKLVKRISRQGISSMINKIISEGQKIITTQVSNSFVIYRLNLTLKSFDYIGSDPFPRFISTSFLLDEAHGVLAGSDKYCNFFINKFSQEIKQEFQSASSFNKYCQYTDRNKLEILAHFNIGQIITSIDVGRLQQKKPLSILYATIDGRIGMFYPLQNDQILHHKLLVSLQQELQKYNLIGSTNQKYHRSNYLQVKSVVDGDFCKCFDQLNQIQKNKLSQALNVEIKDINNLINYFQTKFK